MALEFTELANAAAAALTEIEQGSRDPLMKCGAYPDRLPSFDELIADLFRLADAPKREENLIADPQPAAIENPNGSTASA